MFAALTFRLIASLQGLVTNRANLATVVMGQLAMNKCCHEIEFREGSRNSLNRAGAAVEGKTSLSAA